MEEDAAAEVDLHGPAAGLLLAQFARCREFCGHLGVASFITKPVSATAAASSDLQVSGNVLGADKSQLPWQIIGAGTQYHTRQDHAKLKLAYALTPQLRAQLTLGAWRNRSEGQSVSYLQDAAGQTVYGPRAVAIDGKSYKLAATDFNQSREQLQHQMQAFSTAIDEIVNLARRSEPDR